MLILVSFETLSEVVDTVASHHTNRIYGKQWQALRFTSIRIESLPTEVVMTGMVIYELAYTTHTGGVRSSQCIDLRHNIIAIDYKNVMNTPMNICVCGVIMLPILQNPKHFRVKETCQSKIRWNILSTMIIMTYSVLKCNV